MLFYIHFDLLLLQCDARFKAVNVPRGQTGPMMVRWKQMRKLNACCKLGQTSEQGSCVISSSANMENKCLWTGKDPVERNTPSCQDSEVLLLMGGTASLYNLIMNLITSFYFLRVMSWDENLHSVRIMLAASYLEWLQWHLQDLKNLPDFLWGLDGVWCRLDLGCWGFLRVWSES